MPILGYFADLKIEKGTTHPNSTRVLLKIYIFINETTQKVPGTFEKIIIFHQWPPKKYQILNRIVFFLMIDYPGYLEFGEDPN